MNPTFQHPIAFEHELEHWRWFGITQRSDIVAVRCKERRADGEAPKKLWRVDLGDVATQSLAADSPWSTPEHVTMASGIGRVLTGIANNQPFGDVEGFYLDAQNHGLDWTRAVFRIDQGPGNTTAIPHSVLSWAVHCDNLRVVKSLTGKHVPITTPVNALVRALQGMAEVNITPSQHKIVERLIERCTPDDLNGAAAWCRQKGGLTRTASRFPAVMLAAEVCAWNLVDAMLDAGTAPNVHIDTQDGPGFTLVDKIRKNLTDADEPGWEVYRKALSLSETELLHAEVQALHGDTLDARARRRL